MTARAYCADLLTLLDWMDYDSISQFDYEEIALAYVNLRRGEAPSSTVRRITSISVFARWAWSMPVFTDYKAPVTADTIPHPLPGGMDDIRRMIEAATTPSTTALVTLQGKFALRVSEARAVIPSHFNTDHRELTVRGKGDKIRVLPYSDETWAELSDVIPRNEDDSPLVDLSDSGARKAIKTLALRAGIQRDVSSHDLRATRITDLYRRTKDIELCRRFAGHSSVKQTQIYIGITQDEMRAAVA